MIAVATRRRQRTQPWHTFAAGISCEHDWQGTATHQECTACFAKCVRDSKGVIVDFVAKGHEGSDGIS